MLNLKNLIGVSAFALSMSVFAHQSIKSEKSGSNMSHEGHILAQENKSTKAHFDIVHAKVTTDSSHLVFQQLLRGQAGNHSPKKIGKLPGAGVYSYVWPTNLNSSTVGFEADQGILALALTIHPDFDDTPLYDENGDGNLKNDGDNWHSHWVVLVADEQCGKGALKVKDIPESTSPKMPATWPGLPIFIDSPGFDFSMRESEVLVRVPLSAVEFAKGFNFDGVTAGLRVNEQVHAPLLCVEKVFDVASGDLSLPGVSQ